MIRATHRARRIALAVFAISLAFPAQAQRAYLSAPTGTVRIEAANGAIRRVKSRDALAYDEFLVTGDGDSRATVWVRGGIRIDVAPNSILGFLLLGTGSDPRPVFVAEAGSVSFTATGTEIVAIEGVSLSARLGRGKLTILAALDGSNLAQASEGSAEVTVGGTEMTLRPGDAIEATPDGTRKTVDDIASWQARRLDLFLATPLAALDSIGSRVATHGERLANLALAYGDATRAWREATNEYRSILSRGDRAEIESFQRSRLFPAQDDRARIIRETRYRAYQLRALRRSALARMYAELRVNYPGRAGQSGTEREFFSGYAALTGEMERITAGIGAQTPRETPASRENSLESRRTQGSQGA